MNQKRYLKVKDLEKTQHYKDRNPLWIKLSCAILDDFGFSEIPDETKYHAVALMLLASRLNNKFPDDERWLRQKINANSEINLKLLLQIGFLEAIKGARSVAKISFNDCKSNKLNDEFVAQKINARRAEEKKGEEKREEHSTTEQTRELSPDAQNRVVVGVDFNSVKTEAETENQNAMKKAFGANNHASQFTIEECLRYAEICKSNGDAIQNTKALASNLYKTGASDAFILNTLYPERGRAAAEKQDREKYGEPILFSNELCTVCFGGKMEIVPGKGARNCQHCADERGKPTGFEPKGERNDDER